MKTNHPSLYLLAAALAILCPTLPSFAQNSPLVTKGPIVIQELKHDTGPILREVLPLLPELSLPNQHEIENFENPNQRFKNQPVRPDPVLQTAENSPRTQTPNFSLEFEGLGVNDQFFCNCMPPDNDGAPGATQYMQYINLFWAVYDKSGNRTSGPNPGNSFWSGFGGSCQSDNSGDPIVRYDAAAGRWVVSQFAINRSGNDYECVAVSTTSDATGSYNRYAFPFSTFPDYPKMGVWPDAYYFTFNNFNLSGTAFVGADACAADRSKMLAGQTAQMICFQGNSSQWSYLPSDLDGAVPPASGTPNFVMELDPTGASNINMFNFHVDFVTPSNSTFTGPAKIPVASFTDLCAGYSRGACVKQPGTGTDSLESLGDRLMWRLAYRNLGDHTSILATHSIANGSSSGIRWYEIRNPESSPTIYQSGTFAPDSQFRFMPAIAMDQNQNIAVGYTRSGSASGQYPSLVYAGRTPSDTLGTLEAEVDLKVGTGSQQSGYNRWGDYSSLAVDPTDDCTFWFSEEYIQTTGGFNWHTAIGTFIFPGCSGSADFSLSANPSSLTIAPGSQGTSTINVVPINGFNNSVNLSATGMPNGVTAGFNPNPTATTSTMTITVPQGTPAGTSTVTINGVSGSLSHNTTLQLTISGGGGTTVTLTPASLAFANTTVGGTSAAKTATLTNTGTSTLTINSIAVTGDFAVSSTTCGATLAAGKLCKIKVAFKPAQLGSRAGALSVSDDGQGSPQTVALSGTGIAPVTLTPVSKTFPRTAVGVSSLPATFTLHNKQAVTLTGISASTTGDFNISATTCGATLAAKSSCTFSVVFTPTQTGVRPGTLSVSNSAFGSPETSNLSGTGK